MGYRRLFIIRKDLELTPGKLAAMVGHCAEGYWTRLLRRHVVGQVAATSAGGDRETLGAYRTECIDIDKEIYEQYLEGAYVKTICQARNRNQLMKAIDLAEELGLVNGEDFGVINDKCLTELVPENEDGTTTVGIWFRPLPDEEAHKISKKYHLYV